MQMHIFEKKVLKTFFRTMRGLLGIVVILNICYIINYKIFLHRSYTQGCQTFFFLKFLPGFKIAHFRIYFVLKIKFKVKNCVK